MKLIMCFMLIVYGSFGSASEYKWDIHVKSVPKTIGDDSYKFAAGEWECEVDKVDQKKSKTETRQVICIHKSAATYVVINATCGFSDGAKGPKNYDSSTMGLGQNKGSLHTVSLSFGR